MSPPLKARVLALLGEHHVMTLASVGADGRPRARCAENPSSATSGTARR